MRSYAFATVDVFTDRRFGGNPLAVFPDARGLSDAEMQSLASELNLSETTFVLPPDDLTHAARVRIFTRTGELPFAGHPNVGTAYVLALAAAGRPDHFQFEELAGLVEVRIDRRADGTVIGATIQAPQPLSVGGSVAPELIAALTEIDAGDVVTRSHPPTWASVGNPYVIAEVRCLALARLTPNLTAFRRAIAASPTPDGRLSLLCYAPDGDRIRARMFAPLSGTLEDPATGSAVAPLGALLLSLTTKERLAVDVVQGVEMGRPSLLHVTATRSSNDGIRASVGGTCVPVLRGEALV